MNHKGNQTCAESATESLLLLHPSQIGQNIWDTFEQSHTLQIYTAGNGTRIKSVKVTSICRPYYNVKV